VSINLRFDEEKRESIEQAWNQWWTGELERPIVTLTNPGRFTFGGKELTREYLLAMPVDEVLDHYQSRLEGIRYYGDALPVFWFWFGPNSSMYLGGDIKPAPEHNTVWFEAGGSPTLEELHFAHDPDNIWWRRGMAVDARAVERWGDRVSFSPRMFSGILDTLASFRGTQELLIDLYESPDEVIRLSREITDVGIRLFQESHDIVKKGSRGTTNNWGSVWSPRGSFMLQCDLSCMISSEMFERHVMPDLDRCVRQMDHAFYHLDGEEAIHHLDSLLSLEALRGIQWVPGAGKPQASEWLPLLKRIRDGGKPSQFYVDPEGARQIVRELGGKGFCITVVSPKPMSPEEADDFLAVLAAEDADAG